MTLPTRKFGVEVEFVGVNRTIAAQALQTAGVACYVEGYGHRTSAHWKIVEDGSVCDTSGMRTGGELVSPPLSGEAGLETVRTVLRALAGAGATVNKTCGLHVHVDAADLSGADIARVFVNYRDHEAFINQIMPRSRLGNTYCKPVSGLYDFAGFLTRIQAATSVRGAGILNEAHRFDRYHTVNLASYARHGTLEFRQHSGTVNATKVANWVQFVLYFVENAKTMNAGSSTTGSTPTAPVARRSRGRQTNYAARRALWTVLVQSEDRGYRGNPVTITELARVSGYSAATVNVLLSGLRNRRQVGGAICDIQTRTNYGVVRSQRALSRKVVYVRVRRQDALDMWLGNAVTTPSTAPVTVIVGVTPEMTRGASLDSMFANMPAEIRGFYTERASDFGYEWA